VNYSGFQYYKVVASKSNSKPSYPNDGYAKYVSERGTNATTLASNSGYNGGDVGGKLSAGETYYFTITYCFENGGKFTSNAVQMKMPGTPTAPVTPTAFTPSLSMNANGNNINFAWDITPEAPSYNGVNYSGFQYYKVVASKSNATPSYPNDGYAKYVSERGTGSTTLAPNCEYNGGDVGGKLTAGETYYFTITYCFENGGKFTSNAVQMKVPGTASSEFVPTMTLNTNDGKLNFGWNAVPSALTYKGVDYSGFDYYKIVASKSNPNPIYPTDGYTTYYSDRSKVSTTLEPNCEYNGGDCGGYLTSGQTYYFSVTYCFNNGGKFASNAVQVTVP